MLPLSLRWIAPALLLVAACEVPDNAVRTSDTGTSQIRLQDGRNCFNNRCFDLNTSRGSVQLIGRNPARIPSGVNWTDGFVTPSEFNRMFQAANSAYASGIGRR